MTRRKTTRPTQSDAAPFASREQVSQYFEGETIECLICRKRFRRLATHLAARHGIDAEKYRRRFGIPWARGLTSTSSRASSGWTEERKAKARLLAEQGRFFELAHSSPRRELADWIKAEHLQQLGISPLGDQFETKVRALFDEGFSDRAIASKLRVSPTTVNRRTKPWRRGRQNE